MSQGGGQVGEDLRTRKVELVLQQLDSLPTLPAIAVRLLALTGAAESKIREVAGLISADVSLASKVLSLVGSAAAGLRHPVTSVQQAVVMLGFETIRNLVLSVKVFEAFGGGDKGGGAGGGAGEGFNRAEFWKHSLAVATAAEMLAARGKVKLSPHDAFVCGLLHDLGKVALDAVMPKSFGRVVEVANLTRGDIADVERRIIGLDHAQAGKRLAQAWNLPAVIAQVIWLHGISPLGVPTGIVSPGMVLLVGLADVVARRQHIGYSGNYLFHSDTGQYLSPLGLAEGDVAAVTEGLAEALEVRARAIGLYDIQSRDLYLESIANANNELGRLNQALGAQNRKLALRSDCFDLLTQFYQRIVPAASPAHLLADIGSAACGYLAAERVALFSQDPDQAVGEVLTFKPGATVQDSFLMQMPAHAGDQRVGRPGAENIRPAAPQLQWLLERVGEFLGSGKAWFLPLMAAGEAVGGVVWVGQESGSVPAAAGDLQLVAQAWGMTLRMAQVREQQNVLTEALAAANRDATNLQQQLVRVKALASLGEMAAGAAHEMNNPLAVVCGRAQLLAGKLTDPNLRQDAALIAQQGERLSEIITDLMAFARPAAPRVEHCRVRELVEGAVAAAQRRAEGLKVFCGVRVECGEGMPELEGDREQLTGAVEEVVVNALQASAAAARGGKSEARPSGSGQGEGGGRAEVLVQVRYDALDEQVVVQVTDRGPGMSEETMRQAFSPFYSAKTAGRQRGMGLAKAMRWVEGHGGTIRLDSAPGVGTTVVVILPVEAGEPPRHEDTMGG